MTIQGNENSIDTVSGRMIALFKELRTRKIARTHQEVADILGVSEGTIRNYLYKKREPSCAVLESFNANLNVDITWLVTGQGQMFNELRNCMLKELTHLEHGLRNISFKTCMDPDPRTIEHLTENLIEEVLSLKSLFDQMER